MQRNSNYYIFFILTLMGSCIGIISLYFGSVNYKLPMFFSYFSVKYLLFLNVFPIILCTWLLYLIFNSVWASFIITSVITLGFSWVNYFKILFRNDPLYSEDLGLFSESLKMAVKYNIQFDWKIIVVIIAIIIGTLIVKSSVNGKIHSLRLRLFGILALIFVCISSFNLIYNNDKIYAATKNENLINQWSPTQVYISKGFVYPFIHSAKFVINKLPTGYDEKWAKKKLCSYDYSNIPNNKKVNVISIMMEAYNDFSKFKEINFNVDVFQNLHQLQAESYSGELVTNIFAGGTVNTERSFLTGYTTLNNFRTNINSYVRYFKEQGYTVEGSHPGYEWFYNRNNINEYLGFDRYYFFENYYSKLAPNGQFVKDDTFFPEIIKLYEKNKKTGKPYFSFNVTYQNHGPYSSEKLTDVQYIKEDDGLDTKKYNILNNYLSGIYSTNQEIKNLIDYFRKEKEPVVVILFGDHNPWMGDNNSVYKKLNINFNLGTNAGFLNYYVTPYIIWGNYSAKEVLVNDFIGNGPSFGPYFLMNEFFKLAGFKGNEFMKLSNELRKDVDVVHGTGCYRETGNITTKLSRKSQQKLGNFLNAQYYWMENFSMNKK